MMMFKMYITTGMNKSIIKKGTVMFLFLYINLSIQLSKKQCMINKSKDVLTEGQVCVKIYLIQQNKNFVELAIGIEQKSFLFLNTVIIGFWEVL